MQEYKQILNEWKQFIITESTADKVKQMIDTLAQHNQKILIKDLKTRVTISFFPEQQPATYLDKTHLIGQINAYEGVPRSTLTHANAPGIGKGETNSTWYVSSSHTNKTGLGPLLYEVLIEYINDKKNAALKPDNTSVSAAARSVWEKFDARPDIKSIQLDIDTKSHNEYQKRIPNIKQLTPDDTTDDTAQFSAAADKTPEFWHKSSLSRAYRKINPNLIDILKTKNLIILPKTFKLKLGDAFN